VLSPCWQQHFPHQYDRFSPACVHNSRRRDGPGLPRQWHVAALAGAASAASRPPQARARVVEKVRQSAQPPADRSVQRLIQRRRWTAPAHGWAAWPRSCPPSARQRARTAAAPCLTDLPPKGLNKEGTGAAALCPCRWFLSPPNPRRGLCQSHPLLKVSGCAALGVLPTGDVARHGVRVCSAYAYPLRSFLSP